MAENTVTVDLDKLRILADRVERSANALRKFRFPGLDQALPGSTVVAVASPERVAARFDVVVAGMLAWSEAARTSATTFTAADSDNAQRIAGL